MATACHRAARSRAGSSSPCRRLCRRASLAWRPPAGAPEGTSAGNDEGKEEGIFVDIKNLRNCWTASTSERHGAKVFRHGPEDRRGQEQQRPNQQDGAEQKEAKRDRVRPQGAHGEGD